MPFITFAQYDCTLTFSFCALPVGFVNIDIPALEFYCCWEKYVWTIFILTLRHYIQIIRVTLWAQSQRPCTPWRKHLIDFQALKFYFKVLLMFVSIDQWEVERKVEEEKFIISWATTFTEKKHPWGKFFTIIFVITFPLPREHFLQQDHDEQAVKVEKDLASCRCQVHKYSGTQVLRYSSFKVLK